MHKTTTNPTPKSHHYFLVKLTTETNDALEDLQHELRRVHRRRIPKRALVEQAVQRLVASPEGIT